MKSDFPLNQAVSDSIEAVSIRFNNLVYDLKRNGVHVTVLSLGEAYFDVPLRTFDDLPFPTLYHYSHSRGIPELRDAVARHYKREFKVEVDPSTQLIMTVGSKAAIYFAMMAVLNPGDEVLIHEPTWVSYPEQVKLLRAKPVMMPYSCGVKDYARYVTERTKLIIVNNPHNPRGEVLSRADMEHLLGVAREHGAFILADEAYSDFVLDDGFTSFGKIDPELRNTIVCNSISKNFGISGWRLGYVFSRSDLIYQILKINQHVVTCPATILQYYVAKHWDELQQVCRPQIVTLSEKRAQVARLLEKHGLGVLPGSSTFYFFVSTAPSKLSSEEFATRLLKEDHIAVVPGSGYGASCDAFVRVSFGTEPLDAIDVALGKMRKLIDANK
ncbi:MAG TPA: pyridoxal phosphate-dependent aminotransferase [Polyangia bacterium]|nr:pyridoxal phosphate-dependent aminotransferase [Polyangia bacterium]